MSTKLDTTSFSNGLLNIKCILSHFPFNFFFLGVGGEGGWVGRELIIDDFFLLKCHIFYYLKLYDYIYTHIYMYTHIYIYTRIYIYCNIKKNWRTTSAIDINNIHRAHLNCLPLKKK